MGKLSRSNLEKWETYEIWASEPKGEAGMFVPKNCTPEQYHLLTHTVYGKPMVMKKRFRAPSLEAAKKVYNKLFGF